MHEPYLAAVCVGLTLLSLAFAVLGFLCAGFSSLAHRDRDFSLSNTFGKVGVALFFFALTASHLAGYFNPW